MSEDSVILYVDSEYISPYAMSVFVTLTEKNIPFQLEEINLFKKENLEPGYISLSITRRVPTLIHKGFTLSESSAITEYLEEVYSSGTTLNVYPKEVKLKAQARQIQAWLRSDLLPLRDERSTEVVFGKKSDTSLTAAAQGDVTKLIGAADTLLESGSSNLFGDWSIADTDLALMLNRLVHNGDDLPEKLSHYARRQWERPSVQLWVNKERTI